MRRFDDYTRAGLGVLFAIGCVVAFWLGHRPSGHRPIPNGVVVRFDADDKAARVVIDGKDHGQVPVVFYLNPDTTYAVAIGNHWNDAYRPERGRYYVACDGTKVDD